jgi:argininosuccinate lyase
VRRPANDPALGQGHPARCTRAGYTAGDDYLLDNRLVPTTSAPPSRTRKCSASRVCCRRTDLGQIRDALTPSAKEHAQGQWRISLEQEDCQTAIENLLTARIGATGGRLHAGRSRNDQVLAALRLYLRDAAHSLACAAPSPWRSLGCTGCTRWRDRPSRLHAHAAGHAEHVALVGGRVRRRIRDDAEGLHQAQRRIGKNPLGSAAGYGTPNLDISREATRRRLDFEVTHEPVTAVQLSRGKAEAQLLFEITLLTQDMGRLAADLCSSTPGIRFVSLPAAFTTGSSIMPQKRNPDVFELMRGRSSVAQAALNEVLGITQKLTSGYHRDLQLIKPPLFRGIDSCLQTLDILPSALTACASTADNIRLDPASTPRPPRMRWWPRRHSVSRGLPARGRETEGFQMSIWRLPLRLRN